MFTELNVSEKTSLKDLKKNCVLILLCLHMFWNIKFSKHFFF